MEFLNNFWKKNLMKNQNSSLWNPIFANKFQTILIIYTSPTSLTKYINSKIHFSTVQKHPTRKRNWKRATTEVEEKESTNFSIHKNPFFIQFHFHSQFHILRIYRHIFSSVDCKLQLLYKRNFKECRMIYGMIIHLKRERPTRRLTNRIRQIGRKLLLLISFLLLHFVLFLTHCLLTSTISISFFWCFSSEFYSNIYSL